MERYRDGYARRGEELARHQIALDDQQGEVTQIAHQLARVTAEKREAEERGRIREEERLEAEVEARERERAYQELEANYKRQGKICEHLQSKALFRRCGKCPYW